MHSFHYKRLMSVVLDVVKGDTRHYKMLVLYTHRKKEAITERRTIHILRL
jgi:hypothetical protein